MSNERVVDFVLRKAIDADIETITRAQLAMAWESEQLSLSAEIVKRGVRHIIEHPDQGFYLLAETDSQIVAACMILHEWSDWRCGRILWLHSLYVEPEFRRQGVFKAFYQHLQDMVKTNADLHGIRLYVDKSNHLAQLVYRTMGMSSDHYTLYEWMAPAVDP